MVVPGAESGPGRAHPLLAAGAIAMRLRVSAAMRLHRRYAEPERMVLCGAMCGTGIAYAETAYGGMRGAVLRERVVVCGDRY
eukprot:3255202-Rhodomonas_salina.2